ncbi:MAG: branched-chain amino acid aminotransferase [Candidatus Margulisiibacteriota bacterium]|jgi:branched-chain amino acid aminotransferase
MNFRVTRIDVRGGQPLHGLRPGNNERTALSKLQAKAPKVVYSIEIDGVRGLAVGRLDDLPSELIGHTLIPNAFEAGHVRRSDLAVAEQIIAAHPEILARFQPTAASPIDWAHLPFSLNASKAMFFATINKGADWSTAVSNPAEHLFPFGPFPTEPAAVALHYGPSAFEGLKAYRDQNGNLVGFRWEENAKRLGRSAQRLAMTPASVEFYLKAISETVRANEELVPPPGLKAALYIRPLHFGSGAGLGVQPAPQESLMVFVSPVGPYFKAGFKPIDLLVEEKLHRAGDGGTGNVKASGNYVTGMIASVMAKDAGFAEILWLDAKQNLFVEEVGAANAFFVIGDTLYTPELSGTILPGITRDSTIQLARAMGIKVEETKVPIAMALNAKEAFCTGTAAVLSPVGSITYQGKKATFNNGEPGPITQKLYAALTAIQEDRFNDQALLGIDPIQLARFRQEWIYRI